MAYCTRCGVPVADHAQFCSKCGESLSSAAAPPVRSDAAAPVAALGATMPPAAPPTAATVSYTVPVAVVPLAPVAVPTGRTKSPGLAAVLSLLLPGAGQLYCGSVGLFCCFIIMDICNILLAFIVVGFILQIFVYIWSVWDAIVRARRINRAQSVAVLGPMPQQ